MMSPDFIAVPRGTVRGEVLERIRSDDKVPAQLLGSVFVLDQDGRLIASLSAIDITRGRAGQTLESLANGSSRSVTLDADLQDVALLMTDFNLTAVAVTDHAGRLWGPSLSTTCWRRCCPPNGAAALRRTPMSEPERTRPDTATAAAVELTPFVEIGEAAAAAPARWAALGEAHVGDIQGALGTIRLGDVARRRTWKQRVLTLAAIMGPGLIVMIGDNDAGGVATYASAGQNYGTSLLWTLLVLIPVLIVNQEMVVRLGAVTGVGHARLMNERFGRFWGWFSVGDLFVLNFLTIVTEFIGVNLAMSYFGVSPNFSVPVAALLLVGVTVTGSFRRWEQLMFVFLVINLMAVPLAIMVHPDPLLVVHDTFVPSVRGGLTSDAVLLIIAIVGTTVAPWQLFFQQSNVIDKRITPRWISYERWDTVIGYFSPSQAQQR